MPLSFQSPRQRAFTLIEVLVVITVIALLVAVMLPVLGNAREAGYRAKCLSGSRQGAIAVLTYATDNSAYVPNSRTIPGKTGEVPYHVKLVDASYAQSPLFTNKGGCPHGPNIYNETLGNESQGRADTPSITYGLNAILQSGYGYASADVTTYAFLGTYRTSDTRIERFATQTPLIMDNYVPWSSASNSTSLTSTLLRTTGYTSVASAHDGSLPSLPGRHNSDGLNFTNADGAGRFIKRPYIVSADYPLFPDAWPGDSLLRGLWWAHADKDLDSRRAARSW